MKQILFCLTVLLATFGLAQQQSQPPPDSQQPPYVTPPTFPEGQKAPQQPMPPDKEAPPPQTMSTQQAEQQILQHLSSEPGLSNTNVDAKVSDSSVVLTGSVDTETQHQLALRIAQSYAGGRNIVDNINVRQHT